jgi:multiple sugar transport system substrate-binding protein
MTSRFNRRWHGVATALAAATALATLAACGSQQASTSGSGGNSLTVLVASAGAGQKAAYDAYYQALAAQFKKETGATVTYEYYSSGAQEATTMETSLVSDSGPDIIGYGSAFVGTLYATHGFYQLTPSDWAALGGRDQWNASTLSASGPDATHDVGVPDVSIPYTMAYNKKLFAKAGISAPPTTWTEYVQDAQKIQAKEPGVYGAGFDPADPLDPWKFVWSYTHQLGGALTSPDGKSAAIDSAQVRQATDFYFQQYYKFHIVPPASLTWNDAQMLAAFQSGKIAMIPLATDRSVAGSAIASDIGYAQLPAVPYGMAQRPAGGTPAASIVSGNYWALFSYAQDKKALALKFMKVGLEPSIVAKQWQVLGWAPTTKSDIAYLAAQQPDAKPFLDIVAKQERTEFTRAWTYLETGLGTAITNIASHLATSGSWDAGYLQSQLSAQNSVAQSNM